MEVHKLSNALKFGYNYYICEIVFAGADNAIVCSHLKKGWWTLTLIASFWEAVGTAETYFSYLNVFRKHYSVFRLLSSICLSFKFDLSIMHWRPFDSHTKTLFLWQNRKSKTVVNSQAICFPICCRTLSTAYCFFHTRSDNAIWILTSSEWCRSHMIVLQRCVSAPIVCMSKDSENELSWTI